MFKSPHGRHGPNGRSVIVKENLKREIENVPNLTGKIVSEKRKRVNRVNAQVRKNMRQENGTIWDKNNAIFLSHILRFSRQPKVIFDRISHHTKNFNLWNELIPDNPMISIPYSRDRNPEFQKKLNSR